MKKPNLNTIIANNLNKTAHVPNKGMSGLPNKKATVPFVSNEGYKNGLPPVGSYYRIPSDTLYNPTPYRIKATPNNGPSKWLEAYDTSNTQFPGADYVDEQHYDMGGYISDKAKATQFGQYAEGGSSWMLTNPNRIATYFPRMANGGGLLSRTVTCSNCGWSWKAVDGGTDPTTCHKCGGTIKMKNGGDISIPDLQEGNWLKAYGPGGQTTDGCPPNFYKNAQGKCVPEYDASGMLKKLGQPVQDNTRPLPFYDPVAIGQIKTNKENKEKAETAALLIRAGMDEKKAKQTVNLKKLDRYTQKTLDEQKQKEYRTRMSQGYDVNKPIEDQYYLADINGFDQRTYRGANMLMGEDLGNPVLNVARDIMFGPGKSFVNLSNPNENYIKPGFVQGAGNLVMDLFNVAPTMVGGATRSAVNLSKNAIRGTAGKIATSMESGLLSNASKINPFAGTFKGESKLPGFLQLNKLDDPNAYWRLTKDAENYGLGKNAYFNKGVPLTGDLANTFPKGSRAWGHRYSGPKWNPKTGKIDLYDGPDYLFKVGDEKFMEPHLNFPEPHLKFFRQSRDIPEGQSQLFKKDWLQGWKKEVPKPTSSVSSSIENVGNDVMDFNKDFGVAPMEYFSEYDKGLVASKKFMDKSQDVFENLKSKHKKEFEKLYGTDYNEKDLLNYAKKKEQYFNPSETPLSSEKFSRLNNEFIEKFNPADIESINEKNALQAYTSGSYRGFNFRPNTDPNKTVLSLSGEHNPIFYKDEMSPSLQSAILKNKLNQHLALYRGIGDESVIPKVWRNNELLENIKFKDLIEGDEMLHEPFVSTSLFPNPQFGGFSSGTARIVAPKGQSYAFANKQGLSYTPSELELTLPQNLRFKITKKHSADKAFKLGYGVEQEIVNPYKEGGVTSPQICYDPITGKVIPCKPGAHKTWIFTENPDITAPEDELPRGLTRENAIKNNEFTKEAEDLKNYLIKNQPGEDIEIYPTYRSDKNDGVTTTNRGKTLNEILRGSDAKTRLAFMAHHGSNLFGSPAGNLGKKLQATTYDNCYLGSCHSGDIAASNEFKGLSNFYFRPGYGNMYNSPDNKEGLPWFGVNPNKNSQTGEAGVNTAFFNTTYDIDTLNNLYKQVRSVDDKLNDLFKKNNNSNSKIPIDDKRNPFYKDYKSLSAQLENLESKQRSAQKEFVGNPKKGREYDILNPTNGPHIGNSTQWRTLWLGDGKFDDSPRRIESAPILFDNRRISPIIREELRQTFVPRQKKGGQINWINKYK